MFQVLQIERQEKPMAEILIKIILSAILLFCGVQDLLKKKIFLWMIILGTLLTGICIPFCHSISLWNRFGGIMIGIIVIVISLATAGKIGMGDGYLLCVTGMGLGFWGNLELFAIALLLASVVSIFLLIFRMADRKKSIPFIPFLLVGYVFLMIANR
jgi:leader peptidase (prepilin peptidase)/N-methyltransferase